MLSRPNRVFLWAGPVVAFNLLLIAVLDPDPGRGILETIGLGFFFGTLFAHTTLSAAWTAFGPLPLVWRLPLALSWVALLAGAIGINVAVNGGPDEAFVVVGACLFGQWLLLQFPLWGLAIGYGLRLRHADDSQSHLDPRQRQFGIRELIIITAIVGVVLGIGRAVVGQLGERFSVGREAPIFLFLGVAAVVVTLPLLLAALMKRWTIPGVLLVLTLIGVVSAFEVQLLRTIAGSPGPKTADFLSINAFSAGVMLLVLSIVRRSGYSLDASFQR
jgi:hypothetical protein